VLFRPAANLQAYSASEEFPPEVDEFKVTSLTPVPSTKVCAPRVLESPVALECTLYKSIPIGNGKYGSSTLVVGQVEYIHIGSILHNQKLTDVDSQFCGENGDISTELTTVSRLGGLYFGSSGKKWEVENPLWSTKNW
jgi:flavin reductase (DIM6/NTAB) family NADH-FMN oxidoreductase RutF